MKKKNANAITIAIVITFATHLISVVEAQLPELVSELVKYLKNVYSDLLVLAEDLPASDVI